MNFLLKITKGDVYVGVGALFILAIIMIVVNGAFRNKSSRAKAIAYNSFTLGYALLFLIAYIVDLNNKHSYPNRYYLYFIITGLLFFAFFGVPSVFKKRNAFKPLKENKKMIYTYMPKEEYLYIVFKENNNIYLNNENKGYVYKMKKSEFTDEVIESILKKFNITPKYDVDRIGMLTVKEDKKDLVYYCYLIETTDKVSIDEFNSVNIYEFANLEILDLDKYIILNCLRNEKFEKIY